MKKTCENCRYFMRIPFRDENYDFSACGQCTNYLAGRQRDKGKKYDSACVHWESTETRKKERGESIEQILSKIKRSIDDIEQLLKDDKE